MNFEDELSAPVWDDLAHANREPLDEIAKEFRPATAEKTANKDGEGVTWESGHTEEDEMAETKNDTPVVRNTNEDLLASLAPAEDSLASLTLNSGQEQPGKRDPLFGENDKSPLKIENESVVTGVSSSSSNQKRQLKPQRLFTTARSRRHPLTEEQKKGLFMDPLATDAKKDEGEEFVDESLDYEPIAHGNGESILQQVDAPLFRLSPRKLPAIPPKNGSSDKVSEFISEEETPLNQFRIEVLDPVKVGDITSAHVEYSIRTHAQHLDPADFQVKRRYRDFRWLYRQLQNNHWGKIIPPPPEKQAVGRFKDDFIENRRAQMEKMLTRISQDPTLQKDPDLIMFLKSPDFGQDSKIRENQTRSNASGDSNDISEIHISEITLLGEEDAIDVLKTGGLDESHKSFMNLSFSSLPKYNEPDSFFIEQRQSAELLEEQLRQLYKSLELVDVQKSELASVTDEFVQSIKTLEELEVSKKASDVLSSFAIVHQRIKESLQRSSLQEALTLGTTIDEYTRSLGSIRAVFNQRAKVGYFLMIVESDLVKKQSQLEKANRNIKSAPERAEQVAKDITKLQKRYSKIKEKWQEIGETIRQELERHDQEKMRDFRNNMEIYLEAAIETQKECIELWETFYENNL